MNTLTATEKKNLAVGSLIVGSLFFVVLRYVSGEHYAAGVGDTYGLPVIGAASIGQILLSLLVSLGGFAIKGGGELLKVIVGKFFPKLNPAVRDDVVDSLVAVIQSLLTRQDAKGKELRADAIALLDAAVEDKQAAQKAA